MRYFRSFAFSFLPYSASQCHRPVRAQQVMYSVATIVAQAECPMTQDNPTDRPRRRMKRRHYFLLAAAIAMALPAGVYIAGRPSQQDALEQAIIKLQFFPVRPPSTLRGPGSLYHVDLNGNILDTVCTADQVLVSNLVHELPTTLIVANALQNAGYSIDGNIVDKINAKLATKQFQSIRYELRDVRVIEIAQAGLTGLNRRLTQNPDCDETIGRLVRARELVCQGASVLLASAEYRVELEQSAEAGSVAISDLQVASDVLKESQIDNSAKVKAKLGAQSEASAAGSSYRLTSGKNLYYGIKVAPLCVTPPDSS